MSKSQDNKRRKRRAVAKLLLFPARKREKERRMAFAEKLVNDVIAEAKDFIYDH